MNKKIFYVIPFLFFLVFVSIIYFSKENIKSTNIFKKNYINNLNTNFKDLPILKNDTYNIIQYNNDIMDFKKKKKNRKFWDLLK